MFADTLKNADPKVKELLANLLMEGILGDDNISEERKIEVRIAKEAGELHERLNSAVNQYATPLPTYLEEIKALSGELYPLRRKFLEVLQLMRNELDSFTQEFPAPPMPDSVRTEIAKVVGEEL